MSYPPAAALLNLVVRGKEAEAAAREADVLARRLREGAPGGEVPRAGTRPGARWRGSARTTVSRSS